MMRKHISYTLLYCLLILHFSLPVLSCKYNVRETGFVDFGLNPYVFFLFIDENTPEEICSGFQEISREFISECNIDFKLINVDRHKSFSEIRYLTLWDIHSFPTAVFVSPDGQSMVVNLNNHSGAFVNSLRSELHSIISSPVREEIVKKAIETYGVILLMEGDNEEKNEKYRKTAINAIKAISDQMKSMVKHVDRPPVLISIKPQSFSREKVLLWSLGIDVDAITEPLAAVFYGKARWIGPVMQGEEINERNLAGILSIIGMDCECDLLMDLSWQRGTVLPVRWDRKRQSEVAEILGFDPENPMVKIEANRILTGPCSYPGVPAFPGNYQQEPENHDEPFMSEDDGAYSKILFYSVLGFITLITFIILILFLIVKVKR